MLNRRFLFAAVTTAFWFAGCDKDSDSNPCSGVNINITATVTNSDGTNGRVNATAAGSTGFSYSKDGATFVASGDFTNLAPATYTITAKDLNGCSQSTDFVVAATKTYFITRNTWKFSAATVGGADASPLIQPCQKDNILTFVATGSGTGTGTLDEGLTKCNVPDPQTTPFTWGFNGGETQVNISATLFTGGSSTFTLVSISATQMVLSQQITLGGIPANAVVTFVH